MDMNNEKRIKEVMDSLEGIQRAEPNAFLYHTIQSRIKNEVSEYTSGKLIWLAAASFTLLVLLNFSIAKKAFKTKGNSNAESGTIVSGFNLMNENSINYN